MIMNSERLISDRIIMQKGVQDKELRLISIHGGLDAVSGNVPKTATVETPENLSCRLLSTPPLGYGESWTGLGYPAPPSFGVSGKGTNGLYIFATVLATSFSISFPRI